MATQIKITRDTSTARSALRGYKVSLAETDATLHGLTQLGPVVNNQITYSGVFATVRGAIEAALNYIDTPCAILQTTDHLTGHVSVTAARLDHKAHSAAGTTTRVLGSRTPAGMFLAAAP